MKEHLETFTKAAGVFSVAALILSVFHEVGFFYIVGSDFRHLFSIADYFASVVAWIPESVFFLSIMGFFIFFLNIQRWNFMYKYPKEDLPVTLSDKLVDWSLYFILLTGIVGVFLGPPWLYLTTYPVLAGGVGFVWVKVISVLVRKIAFMETAPNSIRLLMVAAPILIVVSYLSGVNEAYSAIFRLQDVYTIEQNSPEAQRHVIFLRSFDKGVLVRDPVKDSFELIRWDRINKIYTSTNLRTQPVFCKITGLLCQLPPPP